MLSTRPQSGFFNPAGFGYHEADPTRIWKGVAAAVLLTLGGLVGSSLPRGTETPPTQPGVVPVTSITGYSSGVIVGPELVLTSHHGTEDGLVKAAWLAAPVVACDPGIDLALLQAPGLKGEIVPVAAPGDPDTGSATFYGLPGGIGFKAVRCSVDPQGRLSERAFPGNSGGPLIKNGRVIGIVLTTQTVATATQIRTFLNNAGYSRLIPTK